MTWTTDILLTDLVLTLWRNAGEVGFLLCFTWGPASCWKASSDWRSSDDCMLTGSCWATDCLVSFCLLLWGLSSSDPDLRLAMMPKDTTWKDCDYVVWKLWDWIISGGNIPHEVLATLVKDKIDKVWRRASYHALALKSRLYIPYFSGTLHT